MTGAARQPLMTNVTTRLIEFIDVIIPFFIRHQGMIIDLFAIAGNLHDLTMPFIHHDSRVPFSIDVGRVHECDLEDRFRATL